MRFLLLFSATFLFVPTIAVAECNTPIVTMREGQKSDYKVPSDTELAAIKQKHGEAPGKDHVLVIDESDGAGYWMTRDRIGEAVFVVGGDTQGYRYSGPDHCAPDDLPIDTGDLPAKDIKVFEEASTGPQPRSGLWQLKSGTPEVEVCPPMMQAVFTQSMANNMAQFEAPRHLKLKAPFHPNQLPMTEIMNVSWQSIGEGNWQTEAMKEVFSQLPVDGGQGSKLVWLLKVLGDSEIEHTVRMKVVVPQEAAAALGGDTCSVKTVNRWVRVGN